jgi:hypothetical protein
MTVTPSPPKNNTKKFGLISKKYNQYLIDMMKPFNDFKLKYIESRI